MPRPPARCGTTSGYARHCSRKESPCDPCKAAKAAYDKDRCDKGDRRTVARIRSQAQSLARSHLTRKYPAEYREVFVRERTRLFAEHGLDADGRPVAAPSGDEEGDVEY